MFSSPQELQTVLLCLPKLSVAACLHCITSKTRTRTPESNAGPTGLVSNEPTSPFESKLRYNPPMQGIAWSTIALGSLWLISAGSIGGQEVKSPEPEKSKAPVKTE